LQDYLILHGGIENLRKNLGNVYEKHQFVTDIFFSFIESTSEQIDDLKNRMSVFSGIILFLVILLNIGVCILFIFVYQYPLVIGIIMASVVGIIAIQCLFSAIYFVGKHLSLATIFQRFIL
jgi:hypothetical protein